MKILGLQHSIVWKDIPKNLELISLKFSGKDADIFLLPEMFATGYCMDEAEIADDNQQILNWMKAMAKEKQAAIGGSVAVKEQGNYYNRFYFVEPDGEVHFYDKKHLFGYAEEPRHYTAGTGKVVIDYRGWKILLQICYDLRFPVFQRNTESYDLMLNVASWPSTRMKAWDTLLCARAIENQCFVFGLNRIGTVGKNLEYTGGSHCFFPDGSEIGHLDGEFYCATLDKSQLLAFRKKFPFLEDRDRFKLEI